MRLLGDFQSLCFNLFRYWPIHNLNLRNSIPSKILKCILQKSGIFDAGKKVRFWPESDHYRLSDFGCCLTNFFSRPKFNLLCTQGEKCIAITVLPELHKCLFDVKKIFEFLYVILALKSMWNFLEVFLIKVMTNMLQST